MSSDEGGFDKTMIMAPTVKRQPPPPAVLSCIGPAPEGTSSEINLITSELSFGRGDSHDVVLKVEGVSRNHARVYPGDGTWGVEDLGSTNGVYVNKTKVSQAWLNAGDIVSMGKVHYKYALASDRPVSAAPDIDISDTERTLIINPGSNPGAAGMPPPPAEPPPAPDLGANLPPAPDFGANLAEPAAPQPASEPAARPAASVHSAQASASKSGSGAGLWILVAVVAVAIVGGAVMLLG